MNDAPPPWLPPGWAHPTWVRLDEDHHLRPVRADDVHLEHAAVTGSHARLRATYAAAWGWPPADPTLEESRTELVRDEAETLAHESFNYAVLDADETVLVGCVYLDPPERVGADAEISWWVVDDLVGSALERRLDAFVPAWVARDWPLRRPRYVGRDLTWQAWLALPQLTPPDTREKRS